MPPASLARSVLKPCAPKPCTSNYDAPRLTATAKRWLQKALHFGQKIFLKFAKISLIISSEKEKFAVLAVFRKTFSIGQKSNFNFQNRGYFVKKKCYTNVLKLWS